MKLRGGPKMKKINLLLLSLLILTPLLFAVQNRAKVDFNRFFLDRTMRIDYYHLGDNQQEVIALDKFTIRDSGPGLLKL